MKQMWLIISIRKESLLYGHLSWASSFNTWPRPMANAAAAAAFIVTAAKSAWNEGQLLAWLLRISTVWRGQAKKLQKDSRKRKWLHSGRHNKGNGKAASTPRPPRATWIMSVPTFCHHKRLRLARWACYNISLTLCLAIRVENLKLCRQLEPTCKYLESERSSTMLANTKSREIAITYCLLSCLLNVITAWYLIGPFNNTVSLNLFIYLKLAAEQINIILCLTFILVVL